MKLSLLAIRQTRRATHNSSDLQTAVSATSWTLLLRDLKTSRFKTATSLHILCQQLLTAIGFKAEAIVSGEDTVRDNNQKKRKAVDAKETDVKRAHRKKAKRVED
jgi:hypothetical protein